MAKIEAATSSAAIRVRSLGVDAKAGEYHRVDVHRVPAQVSHLNRMLCARPVEVGGGEATVVGDETVVEA